MNGNPFRYSIAALLFVCFVVAGTFAGYRAGFSGGYASGKAKRQSEEPFPKIYKIGDLLRSVADHGDTNALGGQLHIDPLTQAAQTTVHPDEWEELGGPCTMVPLPWLESLAVNATSGVHRGLEAFFADLTAVRLAVAGAEKENEAMGRAREEMITRALEPAEKSLVASLKPIAAGTNLVGTWEVRSGAADGPARPARYTFIDKDTVAIASLDGTQATETWYVTSPASVVISGTAYIAAWAADQNLVLIKHNAPNDFLIASQIEGEQTDERESE